MRDLKDDVADRDDLHHSVAQVDQLLCCREEPHNGLSEQKNDPRYHSGDAHRGKRALLCAFDDAVHAACADILTRIRGHGRAEGQRRQHNEAVDAHNNDVGCDELLTE